MEHYKLKSDEVVLYEGQVDLKDRKGSTKLVLTNLNVVFINKYKRLFAQEEITVLEYPINEIKVYKDIPQVKIKENSAQIYFFEGEELIYFYSKKELHKFCNQVYELITGQTVAQKNAQKVKETINLVDDTLGINTVETAGKVIKNGVVGNVGSILGKVGKSLLGIKDKK